MPKVSIIIPVYNGRKYLPELLESLKKQDYPQKDCEIIAIDDASSDDSSAYIKQNFPEIKIIQNKKNEGFPSTNNIGIKIALEKNSEYIVLLNQDTVVKPDWLGELVKAAESDKKIAAVQPLILFWDNKEKINSSGNEIHFLGFGISQNFNLDVKDKPKEMKEIFYASGAAVLFKAEVLREVGFLDKKLFYMEDLDLGWRIRLYGYKIVNAPESVVYHKYSFSRNKNKYYFLEFGRLFNLLKNYELITLIILLPLLFFEELVMTIYAFLKGWGNLKIKSYKDLFSNFNDLLKARENLQKARKTSDKEICKFILGEFNAHYEDFSNPILKLVNPFLSLYWKILCGSLI